MTTKMIEVPEGFTTRPIPDPTLLTTQQLERSIEALKELLDARIHAQEDRLDAAIKLAETTLKARPSEIQLQIEHLKMLMDEKFANVQTQFRERDTRVEQTARDTKVAVDAALQAAEKAVGKQNESFALATSKSEAATMKLLDQLGNSFQTATKALDDKIGDLKDRFNRGEGVGEGREKTHVVQMETKRMDIAQIALACTIAALVGGIIAHFMK